MPIYLEADPRVIEIAEHLTSMQPHLPIEPAEPRKNGRVTAAQLTPDLLAAADREMAARAE